MEHVNNSSGMRILLVTDFQAFCAKVGASGQKRDDRSWKDCEAPPHHLSIQTLSVHWLQLVRIAWSKGHCRSNLALFWCICWRDMSCSSFGCTEMHYRCRWRRLARSRRALHELASVMQGTVYMASIPLFMLCDELSIADAGQ